MSIAGVSMPSLGLTLDGLIRGIGAATSEQGTEAVGDAVQIFSNVAADLNVPFKGPGRVSDLAGYPDPAHFLANGEFQKSDQSNFVSMKDVLARLTDPDFNFTSALDDAADGFLGKQGLLPALRNPQVAEHLQINAEQQQDLKGLQDMVQDMVVLNRAVLRDMRA